MSKHSKPFVGELFIDTDSNGELCQVVNPNASKSDYTGDKDPAIEYRVLEGDDNGTNRLWWYDSVESMIFKYREGTAKVKHEAAGEADVKRILDVLGGVADMEYSTDPDAKLPYQLNINERGLKILADLLDK